jgi:hypothetical protein
MVTGRYDAEAHLLHAEATKVMGASDHLNDETTRQLAEEERQFPLP